MTPAYCGGLPAVLRQTFRTVIHSRMELRMRQYAHSYPGMNILLLEPEAQDPVLYQANTFGYAKRRVLAGHAFQQTRRWLRSRARTLGSMLRCHGIHIDHAALADGDQHLCAPPSALPSATRTQPAPAVITLQRVLDPLAHKIQPAAPARARAA